MEERFHYRYRVEHWWIRRGVDGDDKEELELLDSLFEGRVIHLDESKTGLANIYHGTISNHATP